MPFQAQDCCQIHKSDGYRLGRDMVRDGDDDLSWAARKSLHLTGSYLSSHKWVYCTIVAINSRTVKSMAEACTSWYNVGIELTHIRGHRMWRIVIIYPGNY
jgi:hypothetical protein